MAAVLRIGSLPDNAVEAAAFAHADWLRPIRDALGGDAQLLVIVMPPAAYDHDDWRQAFVRDLAREYALKRVALLASNNEQAITEAVAYLDGAPGVTGQYLKLD